MPRLKRLVDLLLYSNAWIALAAMAMSVQSQYLLLGAVYPDALWGFIFFATLALYGLHRVIGIERMKSFQYAGRFGIIRRQQNLIGWVAGVSLLVGGGFLLACGPGFWPWAGLPALVSLAYVMPVFQGRRLRDFPYVKIFLIASAWSFVTVGFPAIRSAWLLTVPALLMLTERFFFVFALTLPFDIRDVHVDAETEVQTLPRRLGLCKTRWLAGGSLLLMLLPAYMNYQIDVYATRTFGALLASALLTFVLILGAKPERSDYYYTGLLDGMMIMQPLLVVLLG